MCRHGLRKQGSTEGGARGAGFLTEDALRGEAGGARFLTEDARMEVAQPQLPSDLHGADVAIDRNHYLTTLEEVRRALRPRDAGRSKHTASREAAQARDEGYSCTSVLASSVLPTRSTYRQDGPMPSRHRLCRHRRTKLAQTPSPARPRPLRLSTSSTTLTCETRSVFHMHGRLSLECDTSVGDWTKYQ